MSEEIVIPTPEVPVEEVLTKLVFYEGLRGFQIEYADSNSIKLSNGVVLIAKNNRIEMV